MTDFDDALRARLERNVEVEREREEAEVLLERLERERAEEERRREQATIDARAARHAELVSHLEDLTQRLEAASPQQFVSRLGWTQSGEEFLAKVSTVQMTPARTLSLELDRDDDEVFARWRTDVGDSLEMWRLLEFSTDMLSELLLQVVDQELWRGRTSPPPFPGQAD